MAKKRKGSWYVPTRSEWKHGNKKIRRGLGSIARTFFGVGTPLNERRGMPNMKPRRR